MASKTQKAPTLKQSETEMNKNQQTYRDYVKAQTEKKNAKNKKEQDAAQAKMDKLRAGYTAYRNAYRHFIAAGGKKRKPASKPAPAKSNKGNGKGKAAPATPAAPEPEATEDEPASATTVA